MKRVILLAIAFSMLTVSWTVADVLELKDGSRLVGTIERFDNGEVTIETGFAGTVTVKADQVKSFETDQRVFVGMKTGDRLVGTIKQGKRKDNKAIIETQMGPIAVETEQVDAIWQEGDKSPEEMAVEAEKKEVQAQLEKMRPKWEATLEAGATAQEGNTDRMQFRGAGELRRKTEKDLLRFFMSGEYAEENDIRNTSEFLAGAYYEYLITERFFAQAKTTAEYDEFENLDLRWITTGGVGYYWIKKEDHELKTRAGAGYQHESFMDGTNDNQAVVDLGLNYFIDILEWLRFSNETTYYPSLEALDDYRLISDSALIMPMGTSDKWKFKIGALYEYDAQPRPGVERLDQTYYANVVLDIK